MVGAKAFFASPAPSAVAGLLVLLALTASSPLAAADLDVNAGSAFTGDFGLEVTPGSTCASEERVALDSGIVIADVEACSFLTATNTSVSGTVDFTAGVLIAFGEGFQVQSTSDFSAGIDSSLSRLAYVTDDSPEGETSYKASFRLRLDDLVFGPGDKFVHFAGASNDAVTQFEVRLHRSLIPAENRLTLAAREDDGTVVETPFGEQVMLPAGYNLIEADWLAAGGGGHLLISLNGVPFGGLTGLDNGQARIDRVHWGVADADVDATTGSLDQDDFSSRP